MPIRILLCACAFLALLLPTTGASAAPAARGVQVLAIMGPTTPAAIDSQLDLAKQTGANVVRTEVRWDALEAVPGAYDPATLAAADYLVAGAAARGLKVLLMVDSTPCWASDAPDSVKGDCSTDTQRSAANAYGPLEPARYGALAAFLTSRYGARLAGFEVWNEPDQGNDYYLAGPNKPARYAAILKAAYTQIKQASPATKVLGGAFVGANGVFLRALYAQGIKGYYDILSVHFYDETLYGLRETRKVQRANGDAKPMWLGEFGYSSCAPRMRMQAGQTCVTRRAQGQKIADVFRGSRPMNYLQGAIVYQVSDSSEFEMGLFDTAGRKKPAFAPVRSVFTRSKPPKPRRISLKLRRAGGRIVATGSGPGADFYEFSVRSGGRLSYRTIVKLSPDLTFKVKLPAKGAGLKVTARYLSGASVTKRI